MIVQTIFGMQARAKTATERSTPPVMSPAATSPDDVTLKSFFKLSTSAVHRALGRTRPSMDAKFLICLAVERQLQLAGLNVPLCDQLTKARFGPPVSWKHMFAPQLSSGPFACNPKGIA